MSESLRRQTLRGALWAFLERIGTQFVHFLVTIILARLFMPSDYGAIGMLTVFLSVSQLFIDCGFGSALIRKESRTEEDFSTVFWYNLAIATVCYAVLFVTAPFIASFYKMPILSNILRVLGLNLIINALYTVQITRLTSLVKFDFQAKIAVASCVVSGAIGIGLAYGGVGVWALVGQSMSAALFSAIIFWLFSGWSPQFLFSGKAFRDLFGFGSKIMVAGALHTIYTNISPLIIGRKYSAFDLGYYSRGESLAALPGGVLQSTLGRVIFPVLSSIQNDEMRLRTAYRKYLQIVAAIVAPAMLLLAACAEPIVTVLIGEKWLPCVPYLQILAIGWVCEPILVVNLNILYVKGRSDIVLKLEAIKKLIAIGIVIVSVQFGVLWLCVGRMLYAYIALLLNIYFCGPFIGMGFCKQVKEVWRIYASALIAAVAAYCVAYLPCFLSNAEGMWRVQFVRLMVSGLTGAGVYMFLAIAQRFNVVTEMLPLISKVRGQLCK